MHFGNNGYRFKLVPTSEETFLIDDEAYCIANEGTGWHHLGSGSQTPRLLLERNKKQAAGSSAVTSQIFETIASLRIYHFHDTSILAPMRRSETIDDCSYLRFNAANIAPFLLYLRQEEPQAYGRIVNTVRLVAPFFDDFILKPGANEKVRLRWQQKGSDYPLKPHHLSDGTIRFICLATALLQPNPPATFIIDEPELGLHPYAIEILAELMQSAAMKTQLIVSTQSATLVDYFNPADIVVVNRHRGESIFQRLTEDDLSTWLSDYSLGDLWRKNIVTGGPVHE